ncbi:2-hydroxy-6-oxo-6-phenylhexa-2,4-dienoate hydrolase [Clostridium sp. W14A]|nr:2-hydroxy-6-oxo-6-phenylhexa-2,4-dienoate hydrolase [Clostridium sp. W14A]
MFCNIGNANIYYEVIGNGKPIVMLHGFSPDHRLMTGCMEPIFREHEGYKRIYLDLPGMGKSDSPSWIISTDDMLKAVITSIKRIIPNQNFLLAGQSYGGYLARGIIHKMKNQVDGLLLICPVVIAENTQRDCPEDTVAYRDEKFLSSLSPDEAKEFCEMGVIQNEYTFHRYQNEIAVGLSIANEPFLKRLRKKYSFSFEVDDPFYAKFQRTTLMIAGRQDSCVGYRDLFKIIENYPKASLAILNNAGHNLQIEQPEVFSHLVSEWLKQLTC